MKRFREVIGKMLFKVLLYFIIMCLAIIANSIKIIHTLYLKHKLKLKIFYRTLLKTLMVFKSINKETKVLAIERSVSDG